MNIFLLHPAPKKPREQAEEHPLLPMHQPAHNTNEGSEFLDDALRLEDETPTYTEESMAPGSPENLL